MKRALSITILMLITTVASFAHGGAKHVMGTVKVIAKDSVTVAMTDRQTQTVAITAQTKFTRSGQVAKASELKAGDRVVVEAQESNGKLTAESVRFGKAGPQNQSMKMTHYMSKMSH